MIITADDGTLTITETAECVIYAQYDNRFARGSGDLEHIIDGFVVQVIKGIGTTPETLVVLDTRTGVEYRDIIAENETGVICVSWGLMS